MAHFDKAIPPGGEGKIALKLNLKGYQGTIKKSATVFSNDPQNPRLMLTMQGTVKSVIELRPANAVSFRGLADQLKESVIDIIGTTGNTFNIVNVESNLEGKIGFQKETIEAGKHYRLKIVNRAKQGNYNGYIKAYTDLQQKPEVIIRVSGYIEGDISVKPQTLLVGKLAAKQPVRAGKVIVANNRDNPFKITKLGFDERLLQVTQQPIPNEQGISLEISPQLSNVPQGGRLKSIITIETDVNPEEKYEVQVHIINAADAQPPAGQAPSESPAVKAGTAAPDRAEALPPANTETKAAPDQENGNKPEGARR